MASMYRYPGAPGRVGLIHPMSCAFCADCNRIRLTAEGALKPCLHGEEELPLRGLHGDALRETIARGILHKPGRHNLIAGQPSEAGRDMYTIGG